MKKIQEQFKYAKLFVAKLFGSLDDQETKELNEWENNDRNQKLQQNILNSEAFEDWNNAINKIDKEEQWQNFINRMNAGQNKGKVIKLRIYKTIASIAAVLVLGFSLYYVYQLKSFSDQSQMIVKADIKPGVPQATLILDNGNEVRLEAESATIIQEGNISIANDKGVLAYDSIEITNIKPSKNILKIPRGAEYQLVLPDGTKVWLNSDTELAYTVPFVGNERRVQLHGEAYFDVTHNKEKPFIVETDKHSIKVLGTEFNISSYSEDINIVTTLVDGKVKVERELENNEVALEFLSPGEQSLFNKETKNISKQKVDTDLYTAWKDKRFKFRNEPLQSFLTKLGRWYDVEIFITDESIKDIRFTGDLPRYNNMADILTILEAEMSVHIEVEDNKIIYVSR